VFQSGRQAGGSVYQHESASQYSDGIRRFLHSRRTTTSTPGLLPLVREIEDCEQDSIDSPVLVSAWDL